MLFIALLHYPVYNKEGKIVTTAIANMDIHDIARISKTYGVKNFFVVNPVAAQRELADKIIAHWCEGYGAFFNPLRRAALELVKIKVSLDEVINELIEQTGYPPQVILTGASFEEELLKYSKLKKMLKNEELPYLLIFGTGWGIAEKAIKISHFRLEPLRGKGDYNHLPVRAAVAIVLDRISRK